MNNRLGEQLRLMRIQSGMTQAQAETGATIGFATLRDIEAGRGDPTMETLRQLARVYGQHITIVIEATE